MFSVTVRGHMMVAHSLKGAVFGPAQRVHGATYVVDVELRRADLDADGIVVDIGRATDFVHKILDGLSYRNLDDESEFAGVNTTTEFLAKVIFDRVTAAARSGQLGDAGRRIASVRVVLQESHIASAAYDAPIAT